MSEGHFLFDQTIIIWSVLNAAIHTDMALGIGLIWYIQAVLSLAFHFISFSSFQFPILSSHALSSLCASPLLQILQNL